MVIQALSLLPWAYFMLNIFVFYFKFIAHANEQGLSLGGDTGLRQQMNQHHRVRSIDHY